MHPTTFLFKRALAALFLSVLLAACGGGGGGGGGSSAPPPPPLKYPIPAGLWSAPAGATPAAGNYIYLQSDIGDYIGGGHTYLYTNGTAVMTLANQGLRIRTSVNGDQDWDGSFLLPSAAVDLQAGFFDKLTREAFADPAVGGVEWSGEGRGCNTIKGWVVIDKIVLTGGVMTALDLRFEQHCEGGVAALHGQVHWTSGDTSGAAGPQNPPPAGLWTPDASFVAPAGNYVYLVSDPGDYIGAGRTELLVPGTTAISVDPTLTAALQITAGPWSGHFVGMNTLSQLQPGYYGGLQRYPFNNPVKGGMDWSGDARGCNTLTGWFVVDQVSYAQGALASIDLRFEQHCEGAAAAQHGAIHWAK